MKQCIHLIIAGIVVLCLSCRGEKSIQPEPSPDDKGENGDHTPQQQHVPWPSLADSPWPMYLHDPQHTGRSPFKGPDSGKVIWAAFLGGEIFSSPAIGADGTIYVGVHAPGNSVFAVNPDGSIKWQFQTDGTVDSSPLVAADGTIYIGSDDGNLYALDESGNLKWKFATGGFFGHSSPNISKDGMTIFVQVRRGLVAGHPAGDDFLYALNLDGTEKWWFAPEASEEELEGYAPALSPDGKTIYASANGALYAINSDGSFKWKFLLDGIAAPPSVDSDGNVYVMTGDTIYSLGPEGELRWSYSLFSINIKYSAATIGWDGTLFIENFRALDALDYTGKLKWRFPFREVLTALSDATPIADLEGESYLGLIPGQAGVNFIALNKDGSAKYTRAIQSPNGLFIPAIDSSPAIGNNGVLYVGSEDRHLFALE